MELFQIFKGLCSLPCWTKGAGVGGQGEPKMVL